MCIRDRLKEAIKKIQKNGYAVDNEEFVDGMICLAMPIRDFTGHIVAGISISGPAKRMTKERIIEISPVLKQACLGISEFLGYTK